MIIVYTTNKCAYCKLVKKWLSEHKLNFKEKNVETNKEYQNELTSLSGQFTVPLTVIGNKMLLGYDPIKLGKALNI